MQFCKPGIFNINQGAQFVARRSGWESHRPSISGAVRFFNIGLRRLISCSASFVVQLRMGAR
jgi:hypothetical protein